MVKAGRHGRHGRPIAGESAAGLGDMIVIPCGVRVLRAIWPEDFRTGPHALGALAAEGLGADPVSGAVLVT